MKSPKRPPILCRLGIHRPLKDHRHNFIDVVSGKTVYNAECPCGLTWMVDSPFGWFGDRMLKNTVKAKGSPNGSKD